MTLSQVVQDSSINKIISSAKTLISDSFPNKCWLHNNNYQIDIIDTLTKEAGNLSDPNHLAQYIAASTIIHCFDGWKFFSNAIDNLLNGDISNAIFMAYYAQLRAMMSFFAVGGIGIFNSTHYYFDSTGNYCSFTRNTHKAIRRLIIDWVDCQTKSQNILKLLYFNQISFSDWIDGANKSLGTSSIQIPTKEWIQAWSIDLTHLTDDHDIRNETSYRPQGIIHNLVKPKYRNIIDYCLEAWKASEPSPLNHFDLLDEYLLKQTLYSFYKKQRNQMSSISKKKPYHRYIFETMQNVGLDPNSDLYGFLCNTKSRDLILLKEARNAGKDSLKNIYPLPILSRAYLLLRLASASVESFLNNSGIKREDFDFWWINFGEEIGLWESGKQPNDMLDLWLDIDSAKDTIENWVKHNPRKVRLYKSRLSFPYEFWQLKQFSRAGFWAMGL